jgi:hypothetical protein
MQEACLTCVSTALAAVGVVVGAVVGAVVGGRKAGITICLTSVIYILGLSFITLSEGILRAVHPSMDCTAGAQTVSRRQATQSVNLELISHLATTANMARMF